MRIQDTLDNFSEIIASFDIIEFLEDEKIAVSKVRVTLKNYSVLWIREVSFKDKIISYSYYWLRSDNSVIMGWDNAPHHQEVETFPHHKHFGKNVESSQETFLSQVLTYSKNILEGEKKVRVMGNYELRMKSEEGNPPRKRGRFASGAGDVKKLGLALANRIDEICP